MHCKEATGPDVKAVLSEVLTLAERADADTGFECVVAGPDETTSRNHHR